MKRPVFLTIWLVLISIFVFFEVLSAIGLSLLVSFSETEVPGWIYGALAFASVIKIVGVVLLWMWKKVGFYIVAGLSLISVTLLGIDSPDASGVINITLIVAGIVILYFAMKPVWGQFK